MSITLAIVEDLDEVREGLKSFLSLNKEFSILDTFKTAEEALFEIPKLKPDIVIMDISLPGMNGIEAIKKIKNNKNTVEPPIFEIIGRQNCSDKGIFG